MNFHLTDEFLDTYDTLGNYCNLSIKPSSYHIDKLLIVTNLKEGTEMKELLMERIKLKLTNKNIYCKLMMRYFKLKNDNT